MKKVIERLQTQFTFPQDVPNTIRYKVHMLYAVFALYVTLLFLLLIYAFVSPPAHGDTFRAILIFLSICQSINFVQLRNKQWNRVIGLYIYPLWLVLSYGSYISGGLYASATTLYVAPLVLAIVLLNNRAATLLTVITILYLVVLMLLETSGMVEFQLQRTLAFRFIVITVICVSVVALLAYNKFKLNEVERINRNLFLEKEVAKIQNLYAQSLSHDLRTPLSVIKAQTFLIQKRAEQGRSFDDNIQQIENYVTKLSHMVDDFTQISQLSGDAEVLMDHTESVQLGHLIDEMITACTMYNIEKNIQIFFKNHCKNNSQIFADRQYMQLVFRHLIHNGIQYGKQDGMLTIELNKFEKAYHITIADDGIGIPHDQHEKIFEPFYRVNEARTMDTYTGSGVGLAIVQRIIHLHHGKISIESQPEDGTTFTIQLPIQRPSDHLEQLPLQPAR